MNKNMWLLNHVRNTEKRTMTILLCAVADQQRSDVFVQLHLWISSFLTPRPGGEQPALVPRNLKVAEAAGRRLGGQMPLFYRLMVQQRFVDMMEEDAY